MNRIGLPTFPATRRALPQRALIKPMIALLTRGPARAASRWLRCVTPVMAGLLAVAAAAAPVAAQVGRAAPAGERSEAPEANLMKRLGDMAWPRRMIRQFIPEQGSPLNHPAYFTVAERAAAEAFAGQYRRALITLAGESAADPKVALTRAECFAAMGLFDDAIAALSNEAVMSDPAVEVARARLLAESGSGTRAAALLRDHLTRHPDSIAGRFELGNVLESLGDTAGALEAYSWFAEGTTPLLQKWQGGGEKMFDSAADVTTIARAVDRWARLTERYSRDRSLHNTVLNMFVRAYDVIDRGYWPARVAAAEYYMSHGDTAGAVDELKVALNANPNDRRALALIGRVALEGFNFEGAERAIDQIRDYHMDSTPADLLLARNLLQQRLWDEAAAPLTRVLQRQPDQLEALGLMAAVEALRLNNEESRRLLARVEAIDPDNATAYHDVADQLGSMRQYARSADMYKIAIERAPWWTDPRNGLGLLYMQKGDEDDARPVLNKAFALDPFNVRTRNYLVLLDRLETFATVETPHFIVRYDEKLDPIIGRYFAEYCESIHAAVTGAFDHVPEKQEGKTIIEVFPNHDQFSVRTTGTPWIGTVGASTGRIIAMVSPRDGEKTMGNYQWAAVIRHEYTHTVTLSKTENRIPHWMTEGLAVMEEHSPLRWDWVPMLYRAVQTDELFSMNDITWGFVRPQKPYHRSLAYAQSYWICTYIAETWGRDALLQMLDEYRAGNTQDEVFPKVIGKDLDTFTADFKAWAAAQVAGWGYDPETAKKYEALRSKGEDLIKARQFAEAVAVWEEAARLRPVDALPHQRLAGLYLTKEVNQPEAALKHLERLHAVEHKDNRYARRIARIYASLGQPEKAIEFARQSVWINPYDLAAHQQLAELYKTVGDSKGIEMQEWAITAIKALEESRKAASAN